MATVIRSARLAGAPFLLAARPSPADTAEEHAASAAQSQKTEMEAAQPRSHAEPTPAAPAAAEPVRTPAQPAKPPLSLSDRDELLRKEIEVLRAQVLERAHDEGLEAGRAAAEAEFAEQIEALRSIVASAGEALVAEIHGVEEVLVDIAFEAVCRIIGATLATPEGVASVIREVVREVRGREQLLVRLSPQDFALLGEHKDTLLNVQEGLRLEFVADERVVLGGCIVEVAGGTLDGRLETQLKQLSDTLLGARRIEVEGGT